MVETLERRRVTRLTVPSHLGGFPVELGRVRLLDLSAEGVRIEHPAPLYKGLVLFVDLPPDLGGVRLTGEVMWTKFRKSEQTVAGDKHVSYQSGLAFVGTTPEQQAALAGALAILKMGGSPAGA
jgi:PilZ domain-containing protein